jgi:hypothetical protein
MARLLSWHASTATADNPQPSTPSPHSLQSSQSSTHSAAYQLSNEKQKIIEVAATVVNPNRRLMEAKRKLAPLLIPLSTTSILPPSSSQHTGQTPQQPRTPGSATGKTRVVLTADKVELLLKARSNTAEDTGRFLQYVNTQRTGVKFQCKVEKVEEKETEEEDEKIEMGTTSLEEEWGMERLS